MKIAAFMDEVVYQRGAEKHFISFINELAARGNWVYVHSRTIDWRLFDIRAEIQQSSSRRDIVRNINESDADVVFVMHFKSVWILPFIKKPCVYYLLEPPRAFHEQWLWDTLKPHKKVLVWLRGQIDRFVVRRYMQYGIANSAYSADVGYRVYGRFFRVVYPGVDTLEFYPEE